MVEHSLGKGEVESSILSRSTIGRALPLPNAESGPALLARARAYTADADGRYGYVEARPVHVRPLAGALVTAQDHVSKGEYLGAVYDADGRLVPSSQRFNEGDLQPIDPPTVDPARYASARRIPSAVYGGMIFMVMGHVFFETAARLWPMVDLLPRRLTRRERLRFIFHPCWGFSLKHFLDAPMLERSMAALGVTPRNLLLATQDLRVDMLHYAEPLSIYHGYLHPMMNRVLDHLATELAKPRFVLSALTRRRASASRVFLSRSRWPRHVRVANEAELEDAFRERGFAVVHPQELAPDEVTRLMAGAAIVAATDGSHAHLATFCRPGTRTILLDTRPVPTQHAIEKLRGLGGLHLPAFALGPAVWDEAAKRLDPGAVGAFLDAALREA